MQTPRSRRLPRIAPGLSLLGAGTLLALAGCFDNDPGLQERLVRTQAELQDKSRRVQELETALEKARADARDRPTTPPAETASTPAPAAVPAMLNREQLEETYVVAAKDMRQKVESGLTGYAVEKCTLFKVDMPSVALPYTSKVALNLRSSAGQPYRLEFPVGADWSGKWSFPTPGDVAATLEKASAQAGGGGPPARTPAGAGPRGGSSSTANAGTPARPSGRAAEGPATTGVETIEMNWGGRSSPGVAAPRQPAPPEASAPVAAGGSRATPPRVSPAGDSAPAAPGSGTAPARPAMQSERDVLIQF